MAVVGHLTGTNTQTSGQKLVETCYTGFNPLTPSSEESKGECSRFWFNSHVFNARLESTRVEIIVWSLFD